MSDAQTMVRNLVQINGESFLLAQAQNLAELRQAIEAAVATSGRFVEFIVVGNRAVQVLVSPGAQVIFSAETVQFDERDTGFLDNPYGGIFDL